MSHWRKKRKYLKLIMGARVTENIYLIYGKIKIIIKKHKKNLFIEQKRVNKKNGTFWEKTSIHFKTFVFYNIYIFFRENIFNNILRRIAVQMKSEGFYESINIFYIV